MNEKLKTRAEKSVDWQNRFITPVLLVAGLIAVAASWAVGAISWWLAIMVLGFITFSLLSLIRRDRR